MFKTIYIFIIFILAKCNDYFLIIIYFESENIY